MTTRIELLPILFAEIEVVQRFIALLEKEQEALTQGDANALPEIVGNKDRLADELGELARQRNALLTAEGIGADRAGMEDWCARQADRRQATATWNKLLDSATKARELNLQNGELIRMRMQFTSQALDILRLRERALDLYGPDGLSTTHGKRRIDNAV